MTTPINVTELDFSLIKKNLRDYLKGRTEFKDYNFEGSGISYLLDLLSANTQMLAWFLHMAVNESFLDSAQFRDTVVSIAKTLGYTPRSVRSSLATIRLQLFPSGTPSSITIPKYTLFTSRIDNKAYTFHTTEELIVEKSDTDTYIKDITIREGQIYKKTWTIDLTQKTRFIIPNANIDTTTLEVVVQDSSSNLKQTIFTLSQDKTLVTPTTTSYFLQEVQDEKFEISFGDGYIGKPLVNGNILIVQYAISNGPDANSANRFELASTISGVSSASITVLTPAFGGSKIENIDSIRKLAPLNYQAQNRAVTTEDYETLILRDIPEVESVRVWGGEDNDPPQYGRVFACLKPYAGGGFSVDQKRNFIDNIIQKRNLVSVEVVIIEPEYLYLVIESQLKFSSVIGGLTGDQLKNKVKSSILNFGTTNLNKFDAYFRYSKFIQSIDNSDPSVQNNLTEIRMKAKLFPTLFVPTQYTINFHNAISTGDATNNKETLNTTRFTLRGQACQLSDDGKGSIFAYKVINDKKVIVQANIGTIDYLSGKINLPNFVPENILDGKQTIDFTVIPDNFDITPVRNQILTIDADDVRVTARDENSGAIY